MSASEQATPQQQKLVIATPAAAGDARLGTDEVLVEAVADMFALVNSPRPEHQPLREKLSEIRWDAHRIAVRLDAAMHPQVAGTNFWADYAGWFAFFSVAPALATHELIRNQLTQRNWAQARALESTGEPSWWAGRTCIHPIAAHLVREAGIPFSTYPGRFMHWLRARMLPQGATNKGRKDLNEELKLMVEGAKTSCPEVAPCDVVFVGAGASSAQIIRTLWPRLTDEAGLKCAVIDFHWDNFTAAISRHGEITRHDIGQFVTSADAVAVRERGAKWKTWFDHFVNNCQSVSDFATLDEGMQQAIIQRLQTVLIRHPATWDLRRIASERALDYLQPKAVVAFHPYTPNAASLVRAAKQQGISTILLQHGIMGDWGYVLASQPFDEALVWGRYSAKIHSTLFGPETTITRTGNSAYDRIAELHAEVPEPLAKIRAKHRALVVLATQPNESQFFENLDSWWMNQVALACDLLDAALVIKLHPADTNTSLYAQLYRAHPDTVSILQHGTFPLPNILAASDAMVTRDSTVVIEAGLLDIPAVTVNLTGRVDWFPYAELGGAVAINRREDMVDKLKDVLYNEDFRSELARNRKQFLENQVGKLDGNAAGRISTVIGRHVGTQKLDEDAEAREAAAAEAESDDAG